MMTSQRYSPSEIQEAIREMEAWVAELKGLTDAAYSRDLPAWALSRTAEIAKIERDLEALREELQTFCE